MLVISTIVIYLCIVNFIGFISMWIDKRRAVNNQWRIPEVNLFLYALIGGSLGCILGMHIFHHKTRHWYFLYGMPAILIIQVALILYLIYSPLNFYIL